MIQCNDYIGLVSTTLISSGLVEYKSAYLSSPILTLLLMVLLFSVLKLQLVVILSCGAATTSAVGAPKLMAGSPAVADFQDSLLVGFPFG